jgi:hypothetical protein
MFNYLIIILIALLVLLLVGWLYYKVVRAGIKRKEAKRIGLIVVSIYWLIGALLIILLWRI